MGVPVEGEGGAAAVDRVTEQVAPEERVELAALACERVLCRRVVQQSDLPPRIEPGQGLLELITRGECPP